MDLTMMMMRCVALLLSSVSVAIVVAAVSRFELEICGLELEELPSVFKRIPSKFDDKEPNFKR
jgi:hypothetical protein